jgi:hypothetical protein
MQRQRVWLVAAGLTVIVMALSAHGDTSDSYTQIKADRARQRELSQHQVNRERRLSLLNPRSVVPADVRTPITDLGPVRGAGPMPNLGEASRSVMVPPPPSPGLALGATTWDVQQDYSGGYQTARLAGNDCVHFCWMACDRFPQDVSANDRYVAYNSFTISTITINQGYGGMFISLGPMARAGYTGLDVDDQNLAHIALHQRQDPSLPYHCWRINMPVACNSLHVDDELGGTPTKCVETLWPRVAAARDAVAGDSLAIHEIGIENVNNCSPGRIYYWRNKGGVWKGPVCIDSSEFTSYVIADCPINNKVAIALHPYDGNALLNVAYHESNTAGFGLLNGSELGPSSRHYITNYTDPSGPQAWPELSTTYDNNGVLHIVYLQQKLANNSERTTIYHWNNSRNTSRPVALSEYDGLTGASAFNLNLSKVTVGIGDGSSLCSTGAGDEANNNYVYVTYIKFAGETPAEQADISVGGYWNGELYLAVSNSLGNTWSPPSNLSNTKTPNCNPGLADTLTGIPPKPDSVCRSEHWATIGRAVSDVDIFFISDKDAGAAVYGEGTWQQNPVHYLRLPKGTHAQYVCPVIAPVFEATLTAAAECEYHSPRLGTDNETFTIVNLGNATLSGMISIPMNFTAPATLSFDVAPGPYSITAGNPDVIRTVKMQANNAPEGLYTGSISITHNDATKASPRAYPIDYFVVNNFFCPENEVLKTGVASPGSLALQVESNGRYASRNDYGGLWRFADSSSSIYDASLLIAHDAQGVDTTVFLSFGSRQTNGQRGFRALTDLQIDTSAYGTNAGNAKATAYMCTADSVVGIKMTWYFAQNAAMDEYIIAQYKVYRNRPSVPITNLCVGVLEDQDVVPAAKLGSIQTGVRNQADGDLTRKLGYQIGVDTVGAPPSTYKTATRFRGGVAACGQDVWKGTHVGNVIDDIQPGGGPTDGFLYRQLTNLSGVDLFTDSTVDMYTLVALDRGQSIAAGDTLTYTVVFASDTISDASFKATIDASLAAANAAGLCAGGGVNQRPILAYIGPKTVTEGQGLNLVINATDPDGTTPFLYAQNMPANAAFVDHGNGTGSFVFNPNFSQAGSYNVPFIASDGGLADSEIVTITVIEAGNQRPILDYVGPRSVDLGQTLLVNVTASDPDGTTPSLFAQGIPVNGSFVDHHDGTGAFQFVPASNQVGAHAVRFIASDGSLADSELVAITVWADSTLGLCFSARADYATGTSPYSVVAADLDGDGDRDLAVANLTSGDVSVLRNTGHGTFGTAMNYAAGADPVCVIADDLDGDKDADLEVVNHNSDNVSILKNNGDGTFAVAVNYGVGSGPQSVVAADLDGDNDADLVVANGYSKTVSVLKNNGDGTLAAAVDYPAESDPQSIFAADLDGDNDVDLVVANVYSDNVSVLKNNGDGTFAAAVNYGAGDGPHSVFAADLDGDADADVVAANAYSDNVSVLKNNGDGTFTAAVNYSAGDFPASVSVADLEWDKDADLVVANAHSNNVSVLVNNGDGTYGAAVNYVGGGQPSSVSAADLDGEGSPDLAVANAASNNVSVLLNCAPVPACSCKCHTDPGNCDGVVDIIDVVATIGVAFRGANPIIDPSADCPYQVTDMNCSGATDVVDVVRIVNVAFRGGSAATQFCVPCGL